MGKLTQEDIYSRLREDIDAAEQVRDIESVQNAHAYTNYRAKINLDKKGNPTEIEGCSQIVSSDVFETVEWILPALMDIYSPENGVPEYQPVGPEDVSSAEAMTELVRYQFWRQNDGESVLRQAIKDALMYRPGGIIKYCWEKATHKEKKQYNDLTPDELAFLANHPEVSVAGVTETGYGYNVDATRTVTDFDGPRFYLLAPEEFLIHPHARSIDDSPFVAHRKEATVDYLRRMGKLGYYKNVERAIEENQGGGTTVDIAEQERYAADSLSKDEEPSKDPARKKLKLYECVVDIDEDGDGILESRIISLVGKVVIRDVHNVYERPNYVMLRAIEDTHKLSGITMAEMVEDLQRLNTFLLRQTVDNLAQSNNSRKVYDPTKLNQADLMMNIPGAPIRTKSGVRPSDAIMELPTQPIQPTVLTFFGISKEMGEQRTGVSKALKSAGDAYNQTATGQLAAINQASIRIRQIAKIIASGLSPLFRAMVLMNKKFLTKEVAIRLNEKKFLQIAPDDLGGEMDLILNVVLGSQSRQQAVVNVQQAMAVLGQLVPVVPGILDAKNITFMLKELAKGMGFPDNESLLPASMLGSTDEGNQELQMKQLQAARMEGGASGGTGGATIGSIAGANVGGVATSNVTGGGMQIGTGQPGSGGMVRGVGMQPA